MGLVSGTGSSDKQQERSFVSRISSMTKGISTELTGRARSLPVTPVAERATSSSDEHVIDILKVEVNFFFFAVAEEHTCYKITSKMCYIVSQLRVTISVKMRSYEVVKGLFL